MKIKCPACNQEYDIDNVFFDKKVECICGEKFVVSSSLLVSDDFDDNLTEKLNKNKTRWGEQKTPIPAHKSSQQTICLSLIIVSIIAFCFIVFFVNEKKSKMEQERIVEQKRIEDSERKEEQKRINNDNHAIEITCYLYSNTNVKIIPYCKVYLYNYTTEIESKLIALFSAKEKVRLCEQAKELTDTFSSNYANVLANSLKELRNLERCYEDFSSVTRNTPFITQAEFREGKTTLKDLDDGRYTLFSVVEHGSTTVYWVNYVDVGKKKNEITLTNNGESNCWISSHN